MCMHKLSIVDDTLGTIETPKKYQRLRNWIIRIIIGWIVCIIMYATDSFRSSYYNFDIVRICAPYLEYHFYDINNLSSLIWAAMLRSVHIYLLRKLLLIGNSICQNVY